MIGRTHLARLQASLSIGILALVIGSVLGFATEARGEHLMPVDISPAGSSASVPRVASDGAGNVVAVWRELNDAGASVLAASRSPDGAWSRAQRISQLAPQTERPAVAMDRLGNAVAVWHSWVGGDSIVQAAVRPAGGDWSASETLSAAGQPAFGADVALEAGRATVVWAAVDGQLSVVQSRTREIGAANWAPIETVSGPTSSAYSPRVAMDDQGGAIAVWRWSRGGYFIIQAATKPTGGIWSAAQDLTAPGEHSGPPQVEMDASGAAVAAWLRPTGANTMAQVSYRQAGGAWEPARNLSHRGRNAGTVAVAMNRAGDAIVAWRHAGLLWSSSRPHGEAWRGRISVGPFCKVCVANIALDEDGNAAASWVTSAVVEASFKPAGERWQTSYLISDFDALAASRPAVVFHQLRDATAVWVREGEDHDRVQAVSYDINTAAVEAAANDAIEECWDEAETDEDFEACEQLEEDFDEGEEVFKRGKVFKGTPGRDIIIGTAGNDIFYGFGGNDRIYGRRGRDIVYGGRGNDVIVGGAGGDRLVGEEGRDHLRGGLGRDRLQGGRGRDILSGGTGGDTLLGRDGARDVVLGGHGFDRYRLDRRLDRARSIETRY